MTAEAAIVGVTQLLARYNHAVDDGPWEEVVELFTPDAVLDLGAVTLEGRPAIARFYRERSEKAIVSKHISADVVVDVVGRDQATVRSTVILHREMGGTTPVLIGGYVDRVVCIGGEWRFTSRTLSVLFRADAVAPERLAAPDGQRR